VILSWPVGKCERCQPSPGNSNYTGEQKSALTAMNCSEVTISELEVDSEHVVCVVTALLHGILFLRSIPQKEESSLLGGLGDCPSLPNFSFLKAIMVSEGEILIYEAARTFRDHAKMPLGPNVSWGCLTLVLFNTVERVHFLFGTTSTHQRIIERWHIPIVVTEELSMVSDCDMSSKETYMRIVRSTSGQLRDALVQAMSVGVQTTVGYDKQWTGFEIKIGPYGDPPLTKFDLFSKLFTKSVFTSTLEPPSL